MTSLQTSSMRVRWDGPNPRVGNVLMSPRGRIGYVIRSVRVLHHAANSNRPRLKLIVARIPSTDVSPSAARHQWARTAAHAVPAPPALAPRPKRAGKPPTPAEVSEAAAKVARDRRLAAEAATPARADESRWDDPDDDVRTRSPKQVKGHRRGDVVGRLWRKGTDVTRDMLLGANAFRCNYDIAALGLTGGDPLADRIGGSPGPSMGPGHAARERIRAEHDVTRLLANLGAAQSEMLLHVVVANRSIPEWVRDHADGKSAADREKKALGFLCAVLARVAEWYGFDERRDRAKKGQQQ